MNIRLTTKNGSIGYLDVPVIINEKYPNIEIRQSDIGDIEINSKTKERWSLGFNLISLSKNYDTVEELKSFVLECCDDMDRLCKGSEVCA
jgi:hypothetical protein